MSKNLSPAVRKIADESKIDLKEISPKNKVNLTIIDPKKEWIFNSNSIKSNSTNSIFDNQKLYGKIIHTIIEFVDIAGLVQGASSGEGLGNKFLSHIRNVDAIIHVVRGFKDDDITHVEGNINPVRDIQIIETELLLKDLERLNKRKLKKTY